MEKKEQTSPHGWFILLLIVFTLCIFLLTMVYTIEQEKKMVVVKQNKPNPGKTTNNPVKPVLSTTNTPSIAVKMLRYGKTLHRNDKTDLVYDSMKRHLRSLPEEAQSSLYLHGYEINRFSVGKNFYMYDCHISATSDYLITTILMELPEIKVGFKDHPEYSQYYPTINPYIHAVELVYMWGYNKETMETNDFMTLSHLKILMVSWEDNLYRKSYEQVKNSPLFRVQTPTPLHLQKDELHAFLAQSHVLDNVAMVFSPPILLQPIPNNTPIL